MLTILYECLEMQQASTNIPVAGYIERQGSNLLLDQGNFDALNAMCCSPELSLVALPFISLD